MNFVMKAIATVIESPYKDPEDAPKQSIHKPDETGTMEILPAYVDGLLGLEAGQHIEVLFAFHKSPEASPLRFEHHKDGKERGVFATRSPNRPNPIGKTIVKILEINGGRIRFQGIDMLEGSPVLDIKPYSPGLNPE